MAQSSSANQTDRHSFVVDFGCVVWAKEHFNQTKNGVNTKIIVDSLCHADAMLMAASGALKDELKVSQNTIEMHFSFAEPYNHHSFSNRLLTQPTHSHTIKVCIP